MQLVYLSPVPLTSFAQRPHHFVEWFHRRFNARVIWIEPGPSRLPKAGDWRRLVRRGRSSLGPVWTKDAWIEKLIFPTLPVEPLAWGRKINRWRWQDALRNLDGVMTSDTCLIVGKPCDLALQLASRYPDKPLVFDVMDSMSAFSEGRSSIWMRRAEDELAARADCIVTSSTALQEKFSAVGDKVQKVMNGLSAPDVKAYTCASPRKTEVFGYVGVIASWFDWEAVIRLAISNPESEIRLIGPCEQRHTCVLPPNIRLLGAIAHEAVYAAMNEFSVGLIPFRINALTNFVDPVKYYEYRAIGLPVLSTRFGEMKHRTVRDHVFFFEDFGQAPPGGDLWHKRPSVEQTAAFCSENSWDSRFDSLDFFNRLGGSAPRSIAH